LKYGDAKSIRIVVPHDLDRNDEEDKDQIIRREQQQEEIVMKRRLELGVLGMPEPMGFGMAH
jgi:hypothetical protein